MATTAPRNDDEYNSGGRITAEIKQIVDNKQVNQRLADYSLSPELFTNNRATAVARQNAASPDGNIFQKRNVSVYQNSKPRDMGDTF